MTFTKMIAMVALAGFALAVMAPDADARRGGRGQGAQAGKNNCRLAKGSIKMPDYEVLDSGGVLVATKRVTILWRYVDANCDGQMTWGGVAAEGADYLRIVPRTIYDFAFGITPVQDANGQVQISTHHFGPLFSTGAREFRETAFRVIHHDDLIPGLPAPGDLSVTQGMDGLPIPGLSLSVHLFTDSGNVASVPGTATTWGAKYVLTIDPDPFITNGTIPAGAVMFMDSQLNAYGIMPSNPDPITGVGTCEFGFSEEDWINVNGGGAIQQGPNTANTLDPNVVPVPVHFAPQCSNNTMPE